ncbi:MAG: hopanoid biosynthesis-associated protein HpnK [Anaerolineae bacterium]
MSDTRLIVSADDFGLTEGHNCAIVEAHTCGVLTSASLLACGMAFDDAVERARLMPMLGIGVHLTLLEGVPVLPVAEVPDLVDGRGRFGLSWAALFRRLALGRVRLEQVRREWRAQVEKVIATGLPVTHLDSHKHIHMHPQLLEVALTLADEFGVRRMRLSRPASLASGVKPALLELLAAWARRRMAQWGVLAPDALLGLESSGQMNTTRVLTVLRQPWHGTRELMMHPAYPSSALEQLLEGGYRWIAGYQFEGELAALCDPTVRRLLDEAGVRRIHYGDL